MRKITMLKYVLITIIHLSIIINAQQEAGGIIMGKVADKNNNGVLIEYANVVLYRLKDSVMVTGGVTNSNGIFNLEKLQFGKYYAKISFIGYEPVVISDIQINRSNMVYDCGVISLSANVVNLGEVNITGERGMISYNLDKKVIDVEKNLTSAGGTVLDVLQNVPSISIDAEGGVSVRGNSNVTILINGKPSGLAGISSSDVITQIPANSVDKIEVVTNPSAKYDPEGTAGILNIILKKNMEPGMNGFISLNAGNGDKYNSSLSFNYNLGGINFYTGYDSRSNNVNSVNNSLRSTFLTGGESQLSQIQNLFSKNRMHNANAGFILPVSDLSSISFDFQFRNMNMESDGKLTSNNSNSLNNITQYSIRNSNAERGVSSYTYSGGYKYISPDKKEELNFDFTYSDNKMERNEFIRQDNIDTYSGSVSDYFLQKNVSANTNKQLISSLDYIYPLSENGSLEGGLKVNRKKLTMNNDYYNYNKQNNEYEQKSLPNYFDFEQTVYSAYFIYNQKINNFGFQIGLREERTVKEGSLQFTDKSFSNNYNNLYPSVHLFYKISMADEIGFSYSRRIDEPANRQMNPFVDNSDSLNLYYGNPSLRPQFTNSFEITYDKFIAGFAVGVTGFYKRTSDIISMISILDNAGYTKNTYENISSSELYGAEFSADYAIATWWKQNASVVFDKNVIDDPYYNSIDKINNLTIKSASNFSMINDIKLQVMFNYSTPSLMMQQTMGHGGSSVSSQADIKEVWFIDAAVRKDFFEGRLSVSLRVSDLFNTRKYTSEIINSDFSLYNDRKSDSRVFYLGITYRLQPGADSKKKDRKETGEGIDL